MRKWISVVSTLTSTLAIVLAATTGAEAVLPCPAPGNALTINAANAADAAAGYSCNSTNLTITASIVPSVTSFSITAASITVTGSAAQKVEIINNLSGSSVFLTSVAGGITLNFASIKAHSNLFLVCTSPACVIKSDNSEIIAATSFITPVDGGNVGIYGKGPIDIHTTLTHGGDTLHIESSESSVTWICGAGTGGVCTDPSTSKLPPQCWNAAGQFVPCTVNFTTETELHNVCFPGTPGVACNGGHKEKGVFAFTFIDITNSAISSADHMTFTAKTQEIRMEGANITGDDTLYFFAGTFIKAKNAVVNALSSVTFYAQTCVGAAPRCIDAEGAKITSVGTQGWTAANYNGLIYLCKGTFIEDNGTPAANALGGTYAGTFANGYTPQTGTFPTFNLNGKPPYDPSVIWAPDAADPSKCTPLTDAAKFCKAGSPGC